eukprot:319940_1
MGTSQTKPNYQHTVEELVVYGFVRQLERTLTKDNGFAIPSEVYATCYEYYHYMIDIFCTEYNSNEFKLLNMKSQTINTIIELNPSKAVTLETATIHPSFCYIPDLPFYLSKNININCRNCIFGYINRTALNIIPT